MLLGIRPTVDFVFKKVFGSPENIPVLIGLLPSASGEALAHRFPCCWQVNVAENRWANAHRSPDTEAIFPK
jgi:hypothetical protein